MSKYFLFRVRRKTVVSQKGFTLLELIVVFSVIAILSTIGIASFVSYSRQQSLQAAVYDLTTILNLARSRAYSQVKPSECAGQTLQGYRVTISTSSNSYALEVVCSGFYYSQEQKSLLQPITFNATQTSSTMFFFPVVKGGVIGAGKIAVTGYGKTQTITVNAAGDIR